MSYGKPDDIPAPTPAEVQFDTSSMYTDKVPPGYTPWRIRNDYPPPKPADLAPEGPPAGVPDAPWLNIDPIKDPALYMEIIREYCFDGMVAVDFVPQKNTARQWYHAPWMHYGNSGREPLHGLTAERFCPPLELSATQHRTTQTWAVGFYNTIGASVFGGVWADPNDPDWTQDIKFPVGTMVYKFLLTNATNDELPMLDGAPTWEGLIAVQPADPKKAPTPDVRDLDNPQCLRLLQMDIATRDDRAVSGWMFGTFMYSNTCGKSGWDGLIPVGLQWGNDAKLTQAAFEAGQKVQQTWINPEADAVRISLHGGRPTFGWNGRLNGPADNFISACVSCHSTAEWPPAFGMVPPAPVRNAQGQFVPKDDSGSKISPVVLQSLRPLFLEIIRSSSLLVTRTSPIGWPPSPKSREGKETTRRSLLLIAFPTTRARAQSSSTEHRSRNQGVAFHNRCGGSASLKNRNLPCLVGIV